MSNDLIAIDVDKLPANLKQLLKTDNDIWSSGTATGFPVLSIKGKNFHIRRGSDEPELVTSPKDPDAAASYVDVVVLKTHRGVAKTYFERDYEPGSDDAPTCYSKDGVTPAPDAEDKQAKKCAICKWNQWGSRITNSGAKAKKCSDVKRLAIAPGGQLNDPMLLRVPPTSLKAWDNYQAALLKRGMNPQMVITRVALDQSVEHPKLVFKAVDLVDDEMAAQVVEAASDPVVDNIVDSADGHEHPEAHKVDDSDDEPPPKKKAKAKAKPKKAETPPPEPEVEDEDDEDDDDLDDIDFDDIDFGDDD